METLFTLMPRYLLTLDAFTTGTSFPLWSWPCAATWQWKLGFALCFLGYVSLLLADISPDLPIAVYFTVSGDYRTSISSSAAGCFQWCFHSELARCPQSWAHKNHFQLPAFLDLVMSSACHHPHLIQLPSISKCCELPFLWSPYVEEKYPNACCWWKVI